MKINKDLLDATMMLSFITLVLIGTTDFNDTTKKTVIMAVLVIVAVASIIIRIVNSR
jgi:hypothetical protein